MVSGLVCGLTVLATILSVSLVLVAIDSEYFNTGVYAQQYGLSVFPPPSFPSLPPHGFLLLLSLLGIGLYPSWCFGCFGEGGRSDQDRQAWRVA